MIRRGGISKKKQNAAILSDIRDNLEREDFAFYMEYCVKKWKNLEVELTIVDSIMDSVCREWNISKEELLKDKSLAEPRAMMYYIIKKQEGLDMSYNEIGEMFQVSKSYIHKAVDDIAFIVEGNGRAIRNKSNIVNIYKSIQTDLSKKNIPAGIFEGSKR